MKGVDFDDCSIEIRDSLQEIAAEDWNRLSDDGNPFLRHEFLHALEATGCLGERNGWYPRYFLLYHREQLIAACPAYIKTNSYGEFVFDWAWADAFEKNGLHYYPKLVSCIPYTPCTGNRFLILRDQDRVQLTLLLQQAVIQYADQQQFSSVHWLFVTQEEINTLESAQLMTRKDCQYHWRNRGYSDFDAFLAECTSKRRKTIRRERRHVSDAGLRLVRRTGDTLSEQEWQRVHQFYSDTFDRKWGSPSLTREFFQQIGDTMGERVLIVFAYHAADRAEAEAIACSIMFVGDATLYGRFWGCCEEHHSLHFETCYYQGIEFCIEKQLSTFEPGAQGEHKISRGFQPTLTYSSHWIKHDGFRTAIRNYLTEETKYVHQRCEGLANLLPFKQSLEKVSITAREIEQ